MLALAAAMVGARGDNRPTPRRAKPPAFTDADRAVFFDDARAQLVGTRPDFAGVASTAVATISGGESSAYDSDEWSRWISVDTLETEIKRQAQVVAAAVRSATAFKGGGYRECRDAFSVLAVMFSVTARHDEDARWNDRAAGLAKLFGRAAANCKVGNDNSYREAAARGADLSDLVRGGRPDVPNATGDVDWGGLADRATLMRRMELALQDRLGPLTGGSKSFKRNADDALHEAQVLAALAEVIIRDDYPDADDEEYAAYARSLRDAAGDLSRAADQKNYEPVRNAYGRAGQACSECHELYRG